MFNWFSSKRRGPVSTTATPAALHKATAQTMSELSVQVKEDGQGNVLLSVLPPETGPKPKLDVCVIIDKSGSMGDAANNQGAEEVKLFSKMDLVKRGAEVIARSLGPDDTLTVIAFESTVQKLVSHQKMDSHGLQNALRHIQALQPGGGTALWDGLHAGLHELEMESARYNNHGGNSDGDVERLPVAIILTDGQPSPSPPAGEIGELKKYLAARDREGSHGEGGRTACKLITMGFGYDVNSKLLEEIANTHDGCTGGNEFAFIPDGTMLLTTFVNMMANLQSVCARKAVLRISTPLAAPPPAAAAAAADSSGVVTPASAAATAATAAAPDAATSVDIASVVNVMGEAFWQAVPAESSTPGSGGVGISGTGPGIAINLGCIHYGQPRQVVISAKGSSAALPDWRQWDLDLRYQPVVEGFTSVDLEGLVQDQPTLDAPAVTKQLHRALAVSAIATAARWAPLDLKQAAEAIKQVATATMKLQMESAAAVSCVAGSADATTPSGQQLQNSPRAVLPEPHPILEDLTGQVTEALASTHAWGRWGQHYVKSLLCAHKTQTCNNFKDPGVLAYGGAHTLACREALNTMCDALPVPRPSISPRDAAWGTPAQPVSAATFRSAFNNRYGGCFGPGSKVLMADGVTLKNVEDLRKGDAVLVPGAGASARVACVVTYSGVKAVRLPGSNLSITPWHPVRVDGVWRFPADIIADHAAAAAAGPAGVGAGSVASVLETPPAVYNLVLDSGHIVLVDGVEAVTLGHGFQEDVVRHPFFGTDAVVKDLQSLSGWQEGWVSLQQGAALTDPVTGLVCGYATRSSASPASGATPLDEGCAAAVGCA